MPVSPQVRNVIGQLRAAGFAVRVDDRTGAFLARRVGFDTGLVRVHRLTTPAAMWFGFAEWPDRRGTLAELRRLLATLSESP